MKKLIQQCVASFLVMSLATPSFSQGFIGTADDALLGGTIPRAAANQAPSIPAIVGGVSNADRATTLDRETILRQATITTNANTKPKEPTEFQKYVQEANGSRVDYFGSEFFSSAPSSFAPVQNIPVPSDYEYGPGDEILVRAWGGISIDYRAVVDRNGLISIPTVGTIPMSGVKANQAEGVIRAAISKSYSNFQINVSPGQIKAIRIYVVGQAQKPGAYTVSSLSTLMTALFVTGGPNAMGSMRNVQLLRAGKQITTVDLYGFIAKGNKAQDIKLLDGDTIFIPPAHGHVAIVGKIDAPAIYELKDANETIASILGLTGGLPIVADPMLATLERLDPNKKPARFHVDIKLDAAGQKEGLVKGDILTVLPLSTTVPMAKKLIFVRVDGEVEKPGLYQVQAGQTIQDLVQMAGGVTKEAYIYGTGFYRESVRVQQTEAFGKLLKRMESALSSRAATIGAQLGTGDAAILAMRQQQALIAGQAQLARLRELKPEGRISLDLPLGTNKLSAIPALRLEPGDRLVIPAKTQFVQVYGAVNLETALLHQSGSSLSDYLNKAGLQKEADRDGVFIARADGSIQADRGFFSSLFTSEEIFPGDVIVVPEKYDRESGYSVFMRGLKDWSQVLGQIGLAAAAIKVLRD